MSRCPPERQLQHFLDERLAAAEARAVSGHVGGCERCQAVLERLTEQDSLGESHSSRSHLAGFLPPSATEFLGRLRKGPPVGAADKRPAEKAGAAPQVPGYEIIQEVGQGGMGIVYQARHLGLNRLVALKMIKAGNQTAPRDLDRFRQEAEAVGRLHHPNIVQIYDIGEAAGRPYLALEYIDGGSLVQRMHGDPQPVYAAARLIETLARAVHFAHEHGIIHRDLKPANVLLRIADCELRNDQMTSESAIRNPQSAIPMIADFGLAKRLDQQVNGSDTGDVVGTPSYMAPEQAQGPANPVGPAADVYALGAILYEMLTGRPPFKGPTPLDTVLQVVHAEPVRPSHLRPKVPRDLETICLKCLEKEAPRRYASAQELAEDLRRFRHGAPILARPVGVRERAWKWARRRPVQAGLLLGLVVVTVLGFAGVTWQWREAATARDAAVAEKQEKELQKQAADKARTDAENARQKEAEHRLRARNALYYSRIAQSELQWRVNDFLSAEHTLSRCLPPAGEVDRRGWEWYYLRGLYRAGLLTLRHRAEGVSGCVAVSADGRWIASVQGGGAPEEKEKTAEARLWDARTGEVVQVRTVNAAFDRLAFHPDGTRLVLGGTDGAVIVWSIPLRKEILRHAPHRDAVAGLAYSPDGKRLASAGWDRVVKIHDSDTGQVLHTLRGHAGWVHGLAFHPDNRRLASAGQDATVHIWDIHTGKALHVFQGHKSAVYGVAFSPNGELLVSAGSNGNLKVWELATGRVTQNLTGQAGAVLSVAFSPDGRYLAYGGGDHTVRIWDVESGVERVIFRGHTAAVDSVQFMPHGERLVSASAGQAAVKVWDLTRHPEYATLARTSPDLDALAFRDDGRRLVSLAVDGKLQTWDAASGVLQEQRLLPVSEEVLAPAVPSAFRLDGERLAARARGDERLVQIWDVSSGAVTTSLRGHRLSVRCIAFSPDGRTIATAGCDLRAAGRPREVKIWDAYTGVELAEIPGKGALYNLAFSPDGRGLALAGEDGHLTVLDWKNRRAIFEITAHYGIVAGLAFSRDGRCLASAGLDDRKVKVWNWASDARKQQPLLTLAAPPFVGDLTFSPDGRRLACLSRDLVKMWDAETGHEVLTLRGAPQRHFDPAFNPRLRFSPDGRRLAGTNWDESISVWEAPPKSSPTKPEHRQAIRRRAADERAAFWHLQEAEHCLEHKNVPAARFHLERLDGLELPELLRQRRDRVSGRLAQFKH